jgi:hypothetical protein
MRRSHAVITLICAPLLSACPNLLVTVPGHLYPVEGPLTSVTPMPVYTLHISGVGNRGTLTARLDGQALGGSWSPVAPDDPAANSMAADWDRVYGAGFFTANVLGTNILARGTLAGKSDTTLTVQFIDSPDDLLAHALGVAADNKGNVYKLTFQ